MLLPASVVCDHVNDDAELEVKVELLESNVTVVPAIGVPAACTIGDAISNTKKTTRGASLILARNSCTGRVVITDTYL